MPALSSQIPIRFRDFRGKFLWAYLPLALLIALLTIGYGAAQRENYRTDLALSESLNVNLGVGSLNRALDSAIADIRFLALLPSLKDYLLTPTAEGYRAVVSNFLVLGQAKGLYDQIRFLDLSGMEKIRVDSLDGNAALRSESQLQNKRNRYYVAAALALKPGQVYVSPFDLNEENGRVERPFKPVIRLAVSVADAKGEPAGLIVLNVKGDQLLTSFREATANIADHVMLVNDHGFFLSHPDRSLTWGDSLGRRENSLGQQAPVAWKRIVEQGDEQFQDKGGLWTMKAVNMVGPGIAGENAKSWRVVSFVSGGTLSLAEWGAVAEAGWFALAGLLVAALICWFGARENSVINFYRLNQQETLNRRTAELLATNRELEAAKQEAEQANREKTMFLAGVSHDLRTPLNAILGFSEIMKLRIFGPLGHDSYDEYSSLINTSGQQLLDLINDVLDVSKVEAGKLDIHVTTFNPACTVRQILNQVSVMKGGDDKAIHLAIADNLPNLMADQRLFGQVLQNLLSNAVKFTPAGGVIRVEAQGDDKGGLRFSVSDTGVGMTEDEIAKVLKPYEQVENGLPAYHKSTGLGLYLCERYLKLMDASMTIKSRPGLGTRVIVTFPASRIAAAA